MNFPTLLFIDVQDITDPAKRYCSLAVKGMLIAEPRPGGELAVLACGNVYHLRYESVYESLASDDWPVLEVRCEKIVPEQATVDEAVNDLKNFFVEKGWVTCKDN